MPQFFIQNPGDTDYPFAEDWEIAQWTAEAGATITKTRHLTDVDHPSCLKVISDTDAKGVTLTIEDILPETKYAFLFSYKCSSLQELDYLVYDNTGSATIVSGTLVSEEWAYHYEEFTTPAGCIEIIIYLRAGTGTGTAFYIDDLQLQGNVLAEDPDQFDPSYPKSGSTKRTLNQTLRGDVFLTTVDFNMGFPFLSAPQFDRIFKFHRNRKETYFDDQAVPSMTEKGTVHLETKYDFTDIANPSPAGSHIAHEDKSASEPTNAADFETTEMLTAEYNKLDDDDSNSVQDSASTTGHHQYHKFTFDCSEEYQSAAYVQSFEVTYKGASNDASPSNQDGVTLYLWNVNAGNWVEVGSTRVTVNETITFSTMKAEQAQMFVDVANGKIRVLVQSNGTKGAGTALTVDSYYVEVTVNKSKSDTINLLNRAVLTVDDVVHVKNLTDPETLTRGPDYLIGDDGQSVIVDGVYPYLSGGKYFSGGDVLDADTNDIHISLWFKTSGTTACVIVGKRNALGSGAGFSLEMQATGVLKMEIEDADSDVYTITGTTAINDGVWHHIAAVVDRDNDANCKISVDGTDDTTSTSGGAALTTADETLANAENFVVGADSSGANYITGYVGYVRVQISGTMPTQTKILWQAAHPRDFSSQSWTLDGTRSYWKFNDAGIAANADSDGMITDGSGSAKHLDAVAGTTTTYTTHSRFLAADPLDVIEVKYNQYYRVSSVSLSERREKTGTPTTPPRPVALQLRGLIGIE